MIWALGASLFAHATTFISVSYFDQSFVFHLPDSCGHRLSSVGDVRVDGYSISDAASSRSACIDQECVKGDKQMKILVAIANYGNKNMGFLNTVIKEYRSMSYRIDIVVLSNIPKVLGPGIEVKVGLPSKNPWSLPFGHKKLFAERANDYDLFIYSEDDTLITENNIRAFLDVTRILPEHEIAGFLRYRIGPAREENIIQPCILISTGFRALSSRSEIIPLPVSPMTIPPAIC